MKDLRITLAPPANYGAFNHLDATLETALAGWNALALGFKALNDANDARLRALAATREN